MLDIIAKSRQKRWTENSEWHPKWHPKDKEWYSRAKDDTKNGTLTDDLQEVNNDAIITCNTKNDTKNDTNNWWMKLYILEANFWNDSMVFNKRLLWKRKIRGIPYLWNPKSLFFWEAKRVCFGTSQKFLLKGRQI